MDTPNRKENIAKLLGFLKQNGYASKGLSLEGLDTRLQNDSLRRNLYNALSRDKVPDIGSWDEFSSMVKKENKATAQAQPSTRATSTPLVPNSPLLPSPNKTSKNTLSTDWTKPTPQFSIPTSEQNPGVPTLVPSREHPYVGRELAFVSPAEVTNLNTGKKHYDASKTSVIYPDEIGEDKTRKTIDNYTQAKVSEANRLDKKIEAQLQDIEKKQKELEARLNKRAKELEAEREGEGWFVNFIRSQPARGMDPMSTINRLTNDGKDQDEEYIGISSALHNLRKQKEKLLATKKSMQEDASFGPFLKNVGLGFLDTVTDTRIWDGGEGDLREAGLAIKAIGKLELQKKFNSGQATKEDAELLRTLYKGQLKLTPAEDALLNSKAGRAYVDAITKEAIGYGYGAGETTANMLPFIRDIALSPVNGLGRTVATNVAKSALKSGLSRVATKAISRTARVVGDIALEGAGTALTTGMGGTLKGTADEQIGDIKYDVDSKTGQIVYGGRTNQEENFLKAFGKSLVRQALEYGTEATGGAYIGTLMKPINKYGGKLLTKTLGDKAVSAVEKFFARMEKTSVGKAVNSVGEQVHYDGLPGEYLEEVYNNLLNAVTIGDMKLDTNSNNGVFNPEINKTIIIGLMGAPMATVSLKVGSIVAQDTKTQAMGLRAFGYKQWQEMKTLIGNSDDVSKTISEWAEQNPNATSNQKKAVMRYAVATAMEDAMTVRQALEQKERKKDSATPLTPSQTAEQSGGASAVATNPSSSASESADNTFNPNSDNSKRYEQGNGVILKREDGTSVRAQIVSEENEDGKIEVASSEGAIQGRDRVVYLTREELDQMYQGSFDIDSPDASSNEETQQSDTSIDSTPVSPTPNPDSPIGRPMTEEEAVSDTPHSEERSEEHEWDELAKQVGDESAREIISSDISDLEAERKKLQKEISKPKGQTREEKIQYVIGRRERLQSIDAEIEGLQRVLQVPQMRIAQAEAQEREQNRIKAEEARRQEEHTDKQGNPINENGTLKTEEVQSVDELTDEDFTASSRNVLLPKSPKKESDAIGANEKIKRQANREDGQLLILPSESTEEAGALSSPTTSKPLSERKVSEKTTDLTRSEKEAVIAQSEQELEGLQSKATSLRKEAYQAMRNYYESGAVPDMTEEQFNGEARYMFVGRENRNELALIHAPGLQDILPQLDELANKIRWYNLLIRNSKKDLDTEQNAEGKVESEYSVSTSPAEKGGNFIQNKEGSIDLVQIKQEVFEALGIPAVPFRMTESMAQHVLEQHSQELKITSIEEAVAFVLNVMQNFDHVRKGDLPNTYIFSIENARRKVGKRAVTLVLRSSNGDYLGVSSSGNEDIKGIQKRELLWEEGAKNITPATETASANVPSPSATQGGMTGGSAKSNQSNSLSEDKDSEKSSSRFRPLTEDDLDDGVSIVYHKGKERVVVAVVGSSVVLDGGEKVAIGDLQVEDEANTSAEEIEDTSEANSGEFGLVSDARMEELKSRLKKKLLGQVNAGVDPEVLAIGLELAVGYLDRGIRKFSEFAKVLVSDLGDDVRPYLKAFYNGARDMPQIVENGLDAQMDSADAVRSFDVTNFDKAKQAGILDEAKTVAKNQAAERTLQKQSIGNDVAQAMEKRQQEENASEAEQAETKSKSKSKETGHGREEDVHVRTSPSPRKRTRGQQSRQNEPLGTTAGYQAEQPDEVRVAGRDREDTSTDPLRSGRVSELPTEQIAETDGSAPQDAPKPTKSKAQNTHNWREDKGESTAPKTETERVNANIEALRLSKQIQEEGREATKAEQAVLARWTGWGGLGLAFAHNSRYRSELSTLLSPEEFESATASRLSAYYTPAKVIDHLWELIRELGFKGGNILEGSAGSGAMLARMPKSISDKSNIQAVEIDSITGSILSQLYPDATVYVQGFEKTKIAPNSIHLAITNVPFVTGLQVHDNTGNSDLSRKFKNIHDFCIAKNVRALTPSGIGVFISSNGTLDDSRDLRLWLDDPNGGNVDVLGAFRLNNETFIGAPVTSDIIVVRKRVGNTKVQSAINIIDTGFGHSISYQEAEATKPTTYTMSYNAYYMAHPEHMGGEMHFGFEQGATYRATSRGLYPTEDINQDARLADWVKSFKGMSYVGKQLAEQAEQQKTLESDESVEKGANLGDIMIAKDGTIGVVSYSDTSGKLIFENLGLNSNKVKGHSKQEVISDYIRLKKAVQDTISYQANSSSDTGLEELHQELNEAYDTFVERYGHLNKNVSLSFLKNDVGFPDIQAIEKYEEKGDVKGNKIKLYSKTDIFHKRIISHKQVEKPKDATHAVRSSILSFGRVDLAYIADVLSLSEEEARAEALKSGLAFEDPSTGKVVSRFEYLSGNVRAKLRDAEAQNEGGKYTDNINALQSVIPQDIPAHLLPYALGATWIPKRLFEDYIKERTDVSVTLSLYGGTWVLTAKSYDSTPKNRTFGVYSEMLGKTILGTEIIDTALNLRTKRVTKTFSRGYGSDKTKETLTDAIATASIADKIDEIKGDFVDWMQEQVQSDTELADELTRLYNEQMNNYVAQSMPDDFVPKRFEGASEAITLRPHQAKAAIRSTTQPVLLAHEVGTGKTYTMISAAMEMRRLGTAKKPLIVVQNATVGQFVASAKAIYPQAKILTLNETDKGEAGRRRFYAQIMYNDWDMIIIPQSVFDRIPDNEQRQAAYVADKIEEKRETLERMELNQELIRSSEYRAKKNELKRLEEELSSFAPSPIDEKRAEKARMNAVAKAERMLDRAVDDTTYDFDNLGIDAILVDEAHEYKHLGFETSMGSDIKGVDPSYSKKSQGLYLKVQSVLEKSGGRNVLFATGTPISNTAAEIWTFMRYLMPKEDMRSYGIYTFDDFVRNYGRVQTQLEFSTSGKFKAQKRFVGYDGLSELVRIWSQVADTVLTSNSPEVQEKLPGIEGGKATDIFLPQTAGLRAVMKYVVSELKRFEEMSGREKKENSHIPLTMYGIANAAAIDPRLVDGSAQDDPNTKANETVRQTLRSLKETENYKGTVAIFSDKYRNNVTGFNLYEDIRDKLIAEGVPEHQIAIVSGSMSQAKKLQIFDKINSGEIRVVLGSTATLGTGVNIQERLHTLIHIDAPNRPMDYTQRNGRILRQGNLHKDMNKPVRILRFGVDDSLDVTAYQRLKTKGAIADSIMHGEELMANALENRSIEDEGDNFGDMVATLSGSEYALLKNQAEKDLRKLETKRKQWEADQRYIASNLPKSEMLLNNAQVALTRAKTAGVKIAQAFPDKAIGSIKIGKKKYGSISELKDFIKDYNASITEAQEKVKDNIINDATETRELSFSVNGIDFTLHTTVSSSYNRVGGAMVKSSSRQMTLSSEALGLEDVGVPYALIANAFKFIEEELASGTYAEKKQTEAEQSVERTTKEIEQMRSREGQDFAQQEELEAKRVLLQEYEIKMQEELEAKEAKYAQMDAEVETAHLDGEKLSDELDAEGTEGIRYRRGQELQEVNERFNEELQAQIDGTLPKGHVYSLGMPSAILKSAGIPNLPIELTASRVSLKSGQEKHPFPIKILSNLPQMLQKPIAVFHYGDKAMNVIVEIEYEGRDLLVGLVLNQDRNGIEVNDVRGLFPKDTAKWLNWITQGKAIYLNKEIIQTKITQQRTNLAEVGHLNLDDLAKVIKEFENPNIEENAFDDDILFRGRYVEFQSGYTERADGTPISENAKYAEEAGKFPASLFKKKYGISPADFNMLNDLGLIEISEWHHTGATFRETDYYSWVDNATFDDGYNSRQGYDLNGEYEYNEQGEATYVGEDENPSIPLSEWYKQNKKAIKPIANAYKAGEWTWEREDPSVGLHRIKNREDAERRMIETHFRKEERQYRNIHWGEYPQSLKDLFSTMLKWDENTHYEDIEAEAERLANEFYDAHIEKTLEADRKKVEEGEAKNRAIREKNLSSASKETALMALAKLYGMDEQEAYNKISSSSWYNRNSIRRRSTSSDEASERNPLHAEMEREATSLAHSMGEEVVVVHNEEELVDILGEDGARQARGAKGFYLPKSGKVVIILSNNTDVADVLETIFHEFVGHKGLQEYVGKEEFTAFIDRVHKGLPSKALSEVHREARTIYNERKGTSRAVSYQDAVREATEEYIARVSERGFSDRESRSTWQKIVDAFRDMISRAKLTLGWNIQDRDIRYILWKSFQMKQKQVAILAEAGDIAMRHRLGIPQRTKVSAEGARQRANKPTSLDEANKQFNEQLERLNEETANSTILSLGSPSNVLLSAGVADKPMRLYGNKVIKKMKKHGFSLSELRDLPRAVANPIAVFNNYGKDGSRSILTELQTEQGNFLVAIGLGNGTDVEFNIVRSAFGKGKEQVVDWFNSSYATYINKEKALEYLRTPTLIMGAISNQELSSATKVIESFENPNIEEKSSDLTNGIRFRPGNNSPISWNESAAKTEYNRTTRITDENGNKSKSANWLWRLREAYQDSMLSLKALQDALAKNALGRDLRDFEDAYTAENAMGSKNLSEMEHYDARYVKPLTDAISELMKEGVSYEDILNYLRAKHGLERNEYYNAQDRAAAKDKWDSKEVLKQQKNPNYQPKEFEYKGEFKDYSGLTGLTGSSEDFTKLAQDMVEEFENKFNTDALWTSVRNANQKTLELGRQKNLISKQTYEHIKGMFEYYVPLRGWNSDRAEDEWEYLDGAGTMSGNSIRKSAKGRTSVSDDPIAMMIKLAEDTVRQGNRNIMKLKFLNLAENADDSLLQHSRAWFQKKIDQEGNEYWELVTPDIDDDASPEEVSEALLEFNQNMNNLKELGEATQYPPKDSRKNISFDKNGSLGERKQHTVTVYRGGQLYTIFINGNPRAAQAINGTINAGLYSGQIESIVGPFNRWISAMHTSYNPEFIITNAVRDFQHATFMIFAQEGLGSKYMKDFQKQYVRGLKRSLGLYKRWRSGTLDLSRNEDKMFHDFMINGGQTGYTQISKVEDLKKKVEWKLKKTKGEAGRLKVGFEILQEGLELFNGAIELNTRFATFVASRKSGRSIERSISDAKNITVNFNKKGAGGYGAAFFQALYIFFNPAVQALEQSVRVSRKNPKRVAAMIGTMATLAYLQPILFELIGAAAGGDDDDEDAYDNINQNSRLSSLIIRNPLDTSTYINLPISPELKPFFTLGSALAEVQRGAMTPSEATGQILQGMTSLLPLDPAGGNGDKKWINIVPSVVQPLEQVAVNINYYGEPIYKDNGFNKLDPEWTKAKDANPIFTKTSEMLNEWSGGNKVRKGEIDINPEKVEHIVEGFTGGAGKATNALFKTFMMPFDSDMRKLNNTVMLRKFYKAIPQAKDGVLSRRIYELQERRKELLEHDKLGYKKQLRESKDTVDRAYWMDKMMKLVESPEYQFFKKNKVKLDILFKLRDKYQKVTNDESRKTISKSMNKIQKEILKDSRTEL